MSTRIVSHLHDPEISSLDRLPDGIQSSDMGIFVSVLLKPVCKGIMLLMGEHGRLSEVEFLSVRCITHLVDDSDETLLLFILDDV